MSHQALSLTSDEPRYSPSYYLSYKLVPEVWYENINRLRLIYLVAVLVLLSIFLPRYSFSPPRFWSVVGISIYMIGWVVDAVSTFHCLQLRDRFEARGLDFPAIETNLIMGKSPTLFEQIFNATTLFAVAATVMSWFAPGAGIALGGLHIGASINNLRQRKRLKLQLSLYDEVEKPRGV